MAVNAAGEMRASNLTTTRRWLVLILVSAGSSTIYGPAYLKNAFYDAQQVALGLTNTQIGALLSAYAITATICYLPSGLVADRLRMRTLSATGFLLTAALTFWYATLPSFSTLLLIFVGMGLSTILLWWGVRYKLVRLISEESEYSRNIGVSYGIYGAAGFLVGLVGTLILAQMGSTSPEAFRAFLLFYAALLLALGVLSIVFIPKFVGEVGEFRSVKEVVVDALGALSNPVVLITAITVFFVYFFYTGVNYATTYLGYLGADGTFNNITSVLRQYGVTLLAGPIFGALAHKAKRPSRVIWIGSLIAAFGIAFLAIVPVPASLPAGTGMIVGVASIGVALGFIANGVFGIVSSQLTEGKVSLAVFGAATGVVSLVGFLPDTFSSTWFGSIIDDAAAAGDEGSAYPKIFWILAASAVIAALCAAGLAMYVKRNKVRLDEAYTKAEELAAAAAAARDEHEAVAAR
ncbi:MFS transporter [Cellulomonas sp. Root137]|uniref:MFS transporter n=1 Tax=Cellulomonas sp. Root137 TaxID=1736459 RepID=UPI0006FC4EDB|nr:MFS transporter [Cellulomonas sp. Root137]KQY47703.1 MFS transporter [Cellulomonas sp. Root137]